LRWEGSDVRGERKREWEGGGWGEGVKGMREEKEKKVKGVRRRGINGEGV